MVTRHGARRQSLRRRGALPRRCEALGLDQVLLATQSSDPNVFAPQLAPDLLCTVGKLVVLVDARNLALQLCSSAELDVADSR